jgi:chromosomal replication initiation ATPase DnaA
MHLDMISVRIEALNAPAPQTAARTPAMLKRVIEYAIAVVFEVEIAELHAPTRGPAETAFARQVAMYLAHVACGLSFSEIGRVFERDRTTVAHACSVIEDKRDDARIDHMLDLLEAVVGRLTHVTLRGSRRLN